MSLLKTNFVPGMRDLRLFGGLWLPLAVLIVTVPLAIKHHAWGWMVAWVAVAAAISALGWLRPASYRLVFQIWMGLVFPIGWVVSHLILTLLYFGLFTVVGVLLRLWRDPLERRFDRAADTYWKPYPPEPETQRYFRQF